LGGTETETEAQNTRRAELLFNFIEYKATHRHSKGLGSNADLLAAAMDRIFVLSHYAAFMWSDLSYSAQIFAE
jgi:hypothetical protein